MDEHVTPFGLTYRAHLQNAYTWLAANKNRLHAPDCTVHQPSARCSCGLYAALTDISAVMNDMDEQAAK